MMPRVPGKMKWLCYGQCHDSMAGLTPYSTVCIYIYIYIHCICIYSHSSVQPCPQNPEWNEYKRERPGGALRNGMELTWSWNINNQKVRAVDTNMLHPVIFFPQFVFGFWLWPVRGTLAHINMVYYSIYYIHKYVLYRLSIPLAIKRSHACIIRCHCTNN